MGVAIEDIQAMRRIDACLAERLRHAWQAATQAGPSTVAVMTRSKGKQRELTAEEVEEQLNGLKEEELRCKAKRQQIRERMAMLQQDQAPRPEPVPALHAPLPVRPRPRPIIIEEEMNSDEEEGEYRMM